MAISVNRTDDSATNDTDNNDLDGTDHSDVDVADSYSNSSSSLSNYSDSDGPQVDLNYFKHITSAVYSYCGTEILASYSEDDIYLFDANGRPNSVLHNYDGHINRMTGI